MYSELFQCECCTKTFKTFMLEFMFAMGEIIPPKIAKKYAYKPMGIINSSLEDIQKKLLNCYTVDSMHDAFLNLTDNEQHLFIFSIWIFELELNSIPNDASVCVPEEPKHYIKPFLKGLITAETILV